MWNALSLIRVQTWTLNWTSQLHSGPHGASPAFWFTSRWDLMLFTALWIWRCVTCLEKHDGGQSHLITNHADRQHPVDDGNWNDYCVGNQPFALSELLPTNQVALRTEQMWSSGSNRQISMKWQLPVRTANGCAYLDSKIKREDDEAEHFKALGQTTRRFPGWRAVPGVRGYGQGGRALDKCQQQHHGNG